MSAQNCLISGIIIFYSTVIECLRICGSPLLKKISDRKGWDLALRQRLPFAFRDFRNRTVVWIHAASLGECKLLIKFLGILRSKHPDDLYLITSATRDGVNYLHANKTPGVCAAGFFPLDTIPLMTRVLEYFSVSRLWLIETELWPSLLWICHKKNIPVGIVNARIEEKSFKYYCWFKNILRYLFQTTDIILAQNELYAARYNHLGVNPANIHIVGNIKGHITIKRPQKKEWQALRQALNIRDNEIVLTAGCVHATEINIIANAFSQLHSNKIVDKLIVVPRHLNEANKILSELNGTVAHLNDIHTSRKWDACVISKTGILDDMYKLADAALIGGTFDGTGGHNVWDAARYGIPVFFGNKYSEQNDGCEKLLTNGVGFKASDATDLASLVYRIIRKDASKFMHAQRLFSDTINRRQSVLEPLIP